MVKLKFGKTEIEVFDPFIDMKEEDGEFKIFLKDPESAPFVKPKEEKSEQSDEV